MMPFGFGDCRSERAFKWLLQIFDSLSQQRRIEIERLGQGEHSNLGLEAAVR